MANSKPLVSVVMIFLNADSFIKEAIESVFAQSYDNWELLLVDDGSTDNSADIAIEYAQNTNGRVRYLMHHHHANRGMSASRNLGILESSGQLIAFLDADDVWLPSNLEEQVGILSECPDAAMVYSKPQYWYSWTGRAEDEKRDFVRNLDVKANTLLRPPDLLPRVLTGKMESPFTCSVLIRRDVLVEIGGMEESFRGLYEDQVLFAKIFLQKAVIAVDKWSARYRQHPESICATTHRTDAEYLARQNFLNWLEAYLRELSIKDKKVWSALREAQWLMGHPFIARLFRSTRRRLKPLQLQRW